MALTKADIVKELSEYMVMFNNRKEPQQLIEALFEIMKRTLEDGEDILISGFGKFFVHEKKKRRGRNPQTGGDMTIDPGRVVRFKYSGVLRDKINGDWDINKSRKR